MIRDRIGVKPLFYSTNNIDFTIASEAIALDGNKHDKIVEILPSSITFFSKKDSSIRTSEYFSLPSEPFFFDENESICMIKESSSIIKFSLSNFTFM